MTERPDAVPAPRLEISGEATERNLRLCGFALLSHFLSMHQVIAEHTGLPPVEMLILLATTTANVQRVVASEPSVDGLRGSQPLPVDLCVPMSRRAIARVTGLPTETVRRHVDGMVRRGILLSSPKGVIAPSRLHEGWAPGAVLQLLQSHAACTERLLALGAMRGPDGLP